MTDVARHARIGRTAVYNYYADIEELLIAYALDETERFLLDLRESLDSLENPVERLAVYVRCPGGGPEPAAPAAGAGHGRRCSRRRRSPNSRTTSGELSVLLQGILRDGMAQGYLPEADIAQLAQLIHGTLSSSAARGDGAGQDAEAEARIARTVRFIQLGAGARFDDGGRPVRAGA